MSLSESEIQQQIRIVTSRLGWRLWRNNKGAGKLENGNFIRWGLCNETPALGSQIRSADLIGIRPVLITAEHIGTTIGQLVSIECKRENWKPSLADPHEIAQRRWRDLINDLGGYAIITSDIETLDTTVKTRQTANNLNEDKK